jgi:hypothetical protein
MSTTNYNVFNMLDNSDSDSEYPMTPQKARLPCAVPSAPRKAPLKTPKTSFKKKMTIQQFEFFSQEQERTREEEHRKYLEENGCRIEGCNEVKDTNTMAFWHDLFCSRACYNQDKETRYNKELEKTWVKFVTKHPCYGCGEHTLREYCTGCFKAYKAQFTTCKIKDCEKTTRYDMCQEHYKMR